MKYYVEYAQDGGSDACNAACVVIEAENSKHLHQRIIKRDFGRDDPEHHYFIAYYGLSITENFKDFISNVRNGSETISCIIEVRNLNLTNKEIIDYYQDKNCDKMVDVSDWI
jgi:hypothetical protein